MDKILVTIYVLTLEKEYDILLPINLVGSEALNLIQQIIQELDDSYQINPSAFLYDESGQLINLKNTVKFSGLTNGCKVLLT